MASWSGQRSWRRRPWQNLTGSRTTSASAAAWSACSSALSIRHYRLDERERQQRLAVLAGQLHALRGLAETAVGEPRGGLESVAKAGTVRLPAEHPQHEDDELFTIGCLLTDRTHETL